MSSRRFCSIRSLTILLSLSISCALLLSPLLPAGSGHSLHQNGEAQSRGPKPETGPPAADLPNLDEVRRRHHPEPEVPVPVESAIRSHRKPLAPRNGRKVGDLPPLLGEGAPNPTLKSAPTSRVAVSESSYVIRRANPKRPAAGTRSHHFGATARARVLSPTPIGDDQYMQNFFQWALVRGPHADETLYWDDIMRVAYAHGQTSMVMAVRELGKTLFESAEYTVRGRSNHYYVYDLYKTYLMREPDSGGWTFWESLVPSLGREAIRRAFDEGGEFVGDVATITPNGSASGAVSSLLSARVDPKNQSGHQIMARDAEWSAMVLSLTGRAGLDLGLGVSYSSAATYTRSGPYIYYDEDNGFPSPGFRLGFPAIQEKFFDAQIAQNAYLLITSAGSRVELRQVGTSNIYEAANSSYLQVTDNTSYLTLRSPDGTQLNYIKIENEWRCNQVKDRNGNYLTANYTSLGDLSNITDTLGRLIVFNYDSNANLISITQTWNGQPHTWATFSWTTTTVQPSFTSVALVGAPPLGTPIPVLWKVGLADGSYYRFTYNSTPTGQVNLFERWTADGLHRGYVSYDYESNTSDCPRITAAHDFADYWNGAQGVPADITTQFSVAGDGGYRMVTPDGVIYKEYYGTSWQKGLVTSTKIFANATDEAANSTQKSTTATWTQDDTNLSYEKNPRPTETNIYDAAGNRRRSKMGYTTFTLPGGASCSLTGDIYEYAANATTVLRRRHSDYRYDSAYLDRRIIGLPGTQYVCDGSQGEIPCGNSSGASLVSKVAFDYDWANFASETLRPTPQPATQHDQANYSNNFVYGRGNLVWTGRYNVNDGSYVEHKTNYYETGTVIEDRDALGHQTTIGYTDSFSDGNNGRNTFAYPTTVTDADWKSSYIKYNFDFGAVTEKQTPSPNAGQTAPKQTMVYDSAGRVLQVSNSVNNGYTRFVYGPNYTQSFASINIVADEAYSIQYFDGAGRVFSAASNHPGSAGGYSAQTTIYDVMGRMWKQSKPTEINTGWAPAGDDAAGSIYSQQTYDWKGRPLITTNTDGTTKTATYSGCGCAGGQVATLTDEGTIDPATNSAKKRQQKIYSDVFDRTLKTEVLNWQSGSVYSATVNTYNVLDDLTQVRQYAGAEGSQTYQDSTMAYDGYGRLKTRHTPEQQVDPNNSSSTDHTTYIYNSDDTVYSITDARGAISTLTYNGRHLNTGATYTAPSGITLPAAVSYAYDDAGNRISMNDGMGSVTYSYDQLSRLQWENRHFNGVSNPSSTDHNYKLTYAYNLAGGIKSITDPFNAQIAYIFDAAGRPTSVTGSGFANISTYASNIQYRAWGGQKSVSYGDSSSATTTYNARMQPSSYQLTTVSPGSTWIKLREQFQYYADGRLQQMTDLDDRDNDIGYPDTARHFTRVNKFDQAGRLITASGLTSLPFNQGYAYDAFNNMTYRAGTYYYQSWSADSGTYQNNKRQDWDYFADGQVKHTPIARDYNNNVTAFRDWSYDAAGRMIQVKETITATNSISTYVTSYDGDGQQALEYSPENPNNSKHYIVRSSVLGGKVLTRTDYLGNKTVTTFSVDGLLTVVQYGVDFANTTAYAFWKHIDPLGLSEAEDRKPVYDPLGNYIAWQHAPSTPPNWYPPNSSSGGGLGSLFGFAQDKSCTLDRIPINCDLAMRLLNNGSAVPCRNNDCSPQHVTGQDQQGNPTGGWIIPNGSGGAWITDGTDSAWLDPDDTEDSTALQAFSNSFGPVKKKKKRRTQSEPQNIWQSVRFEDLWRNHPSNVPDNPNLVGNRNCPCTAADGHTCSYTNECAVRLSAALQQCGIVMSSYRGEKCGVSGYAVNAHGLATWMSDSHRLGRPQVFKNGTDALNQIRGVTGVIYIRQFAGVDQPNQRWDHIDLWNGERLGHGFSEFITNSPIYVWFWPVK